MKKTSPYIFAWLAAVALAFGLAFVSPNEASVMGRLPDFMSRTLLHKPVAVPEGLPSDRTLALITFQRGHRAQVEGWINGLDLRNDRSINWMRMPVINDPGTLTGRDAAETKLLQHYPFEAERANLVPVFADRDSFARSAGLNGIDQAYVLVVNRQGDVLARVEGEFDAEKAATLRETLKAQDL